MPEPYDVTQEVWGAGEADVNGKTSIPVIIAAEHRSASPEIIFTAWHQTQPDETTRARLAMAARAPTFYRLLEQVVLSGGIPADLEEVIRINLARAAPKVYPMPDLERPERKNAWQKLLDDDLG
jgi:hypothetical protein